MLTESCRTLPNQERQNTTIDKTSAANQAYAVAVAQAEQYYEETLAGRPRNPHDYWIYEIVRREVDELGVPRTAEQLESLFAAASDQLRAERAGDAARTFAKLIELASQDAALSD